MGRMLHVDGEDVTDIVLEAVDWIRLVVDRVQWQAIVNTVMNLRVPSKAGNFLST
jgi:hypothetical protein